MSKISLHVKVKESDHPLPGTRSWVAKMIEESTLSVSKSKSGKPGIWMNHGDKSQNMVLFDPESSFGPWELFNDGMFVPSLFDVSMTKAGTSLLLDFSKKCKTLLKRRMKQNDQVLKERLTVKILSK